VSTLAFLDLPMARSKPRKRYNPARAKQALLNARARQCSLIRWLSRDTEKGSFHAAGPYGTTANVEALEQVMAQPTTWQAYLVLCFSDAPGSYYEEMVILPPVGPITVNQDASALESLVDAALEHTSLSREHAHYLDTLITVQPTSPELQQQLEEDAWVDEQALARYRYLSQSILETTIARLEVAADAAIQNQ
jgi:hypothetical protein